MLYNNIEVKNKMVKYFIKLTAIQAMFTKGILEIDTIANFEKKVNEDGARCEEDLLILPGTLSDRYKAIMHHMPTKMIRSHFHSLIIISEGKCELLIGGATHKVVTDYLVIIPENIVYTINCPEPCEGFCLHIHPEFLKPILPGILNEHFSFFNRNIKYTFRLTARESRLVQNCFRDLIRAYDQKSPERKFLLRDFTHILLLHIRGIYRTFSESVSTSNNRTAILATRFIHFVEQNFKEMHSVQQYADLLNISPKYLTKIIKKETGKTPQAYIQDMLLLEAKSMLQMTDHSISEIAFILNFTDQPHFSHFIKKQTGLTPNDLRIKA